MLFIFVFSTFPRCLFEVCLHVNCSDYHVAAFRTFPLFSPLFHFCLLIWFACTFCCCLSFAILFFLLNVMQIAVIMHFFPFDNIPFVSPAFFNFLEVFMSFWLFSFFVEGFSAQGQRRKSSGVAECHKIWMQFFLLPLLQFRWKWEVICSVFMAVGVSSGKHFLWVRGFYVQAAIVDWICDERSKVNKSSGIISFDCLTRFNPEFLHLSEGELCAKWEIVSTSSFKLLKCIYKIGLKQNDVWLE